MKPPRLHLGMLLLILSALARADGNPSQFTYVEPEAGTSGTSGARPAENRQPTKPDPFAEIKRKLASNPDLLTNETEVGLSELAGLAASLPKGDPTRARYDAEILRRVGNQSSQFYKLNRSQQEEALDAERRQEQRTERQNQQQPPQIFVQQIAPPPGGQQGQQTQAGGGAMAPSGSGGTGSDQPADAAATTTEKGDSGAKDGKTVTAAIGIHRGSELTIDFSGVLPGASPAGASPAGASPAGTTATSGTAPADPAGTDSAHH